MPSKTFTAQPSPKTKAFTSADDELAQLETQLTRAVAEVARLKAAITVQRAKTAALFNTAVEADRRTS